MFKNPPKNNPIKLKNSINQELEKASAHINDFTAPLPLSLYHKGGVTMHGKQNKNELYSYKVTFRFTFVFKLIYTAAESRLYI